MTRLRFMATVAMATVGAAILALPAVASPAGAIGHQIRAYQQPPALITKDMDFLAAARRKVIEPVDTIVRAWPEGIGYIPTVYVPFIITPIEHTIITVGHILPEDGDGRPYIVGRSGGVIYST